MIRFRTERDKEEILAALQENMNEEFRATLQYVCHRISARTQDEVMADSFKSAALDEMAHILFFSDILSRHGAEPVYADWNIDRSADLKTMLEKDIELERAARQRYEAQLERMQDYPELVSLIRSILSDEEDHEEEFQRYLSNLSG